MLRLPPAVLDAVNAHAEEAFPSECCGILIGRFGDDGARIAEEAFRARNLREDERNDRYEMHPEDRKRAEDEAATAGREVVGFYHSHPDHDAYFSQTDLENSEEYLWGEPWIPPTYAYLVTSIRDGRYSHHKAFLVVDGEAVEEEIAG